MIIRELNNFLTNRLMMKKITLFLIMLGFFLTASAQYNFPTIVGPTNVAEGSPVTINLNDVANTAGVPASSSGSYESFSISADWVAGGANPYSNEADLTVTTTAGSVLIDPPTTSGALGADAVITFVGDFAGLYDPTTDGSLDLVLNQSWADSDANWSNIVVTLFESPTCPEPTGIMSSSVTSDSAILDWTAGDSETEWNIEYSGGADFTPGNGEEEVSAPVTGSPNTTLSGLTPATTYYVYYQANCGPSDLSLWVGPFIFATECVTFTAPYTEGFENAGDIPLCWSMSGGEDWEFADDGGFDNIGDGGTLSGSTATNNYFAWVDASGDDGPSTLTSPLVDVSGLTAPALSFYEISDNQGDANSTLDVEVWDGAAWNNVGTFNTNTVGWELKVIDLGGLTITGDIQARFIFSETVPGDFTDDIAIDDVTIDEAPSCFNPSMLTASTITSNSAELSWTQGGTVVSWNIEIVPSGTAPTGTPTATDISNPYDATGLSAITSYDYYVQADCGGELSGWAGPFTFETLCDVYIPDYIENFTTIPAQCWEEADSGDATTGPMELGNSLWGADGFQNDGTTGAYRINLYQGGVRSDWIISPRFDLTGGPFQVEFDFGIMLFANSTTPGTLGSDDTVQLLVTNDDGATWTNLLTYDSSSVVPLTGEHPVIDLTAYSGQIVQFAILASDGTVDDSEDVDVFVDNFRVRGIPTCPEPTDLTANNLSLTSTEVGWTENGTSASWNIQYGEAGFALGTGTIEAGVDTNPFILTGLTPDTSYEFYVQAICGPGNESSFNGPFQFFTGYCESIPSSNDGDGINNVTVGFTDFPSIGDVTYENNTSPVINVFQGINTNVEIEFDHGFTYNTNIWIDFNDNLIFEDTEIVFQGESDGIGDPQFFDASFVMPLTAPIGEHRMRIGAADFGQATPDPCYDGTWGITLDFTVNIQELLCTLAEANYTTVPDCANDQFFIDVNITSLGDATSLEISNNFDAGTIQALALDTFQAGPFPFGTAVKIFVTNEQDNNCVISSETFEVLACPPSNDECADATVAVVNPGESCEQVNSGTILAATPSGVPSGSCSGNPDDDVWFQFTAIGTQQIIEIQNVAGGTFNLDHALYEGSCGALSEVYCTADDFSLTPELIVGNTYYVRVFSAGSIAETSTFDLCISTLGIPVYCLDALPICAAQDIEYESIVGDQTAPPYLDYDCLGSQPDPQWNTILFDDAGDYVFTLEQTNAGGAGLDIDFIVWGPFVDQQGGCVELLPDTIADCSFSGTSIETIELNGVPANSTYIILITNFSQQEGNYTFVQDSGPTDGTNCDVVCDVVLELDGAPVEDDIESPAELDEIFDFCGFDDGVLLEATTFYDVDTYQWFQDGELVTELDDQGNVIDYNEPTLTATETGTYQVRVLGGICDQSVLYFSAYIQINFYDSPEPVEPQTITLCDGPEADGAASFNLDALTAELALDGFTISYYTDPTDANQAMGAITATDGFSSTGETIFMRIEDSDAATDGYLGCRELSSVELIVNPVPTINQPEPLFVCDDMDGSIDGTTEFDLTSINTEVTTEDGIEVTYHNSQEDADEDTGDITSTTYSSAGETLYIRAENTTTGCYQTTTFDIDVNLPPVAEFNNENIDYEVCPNATVPISIGFEPDNFTDSEVSISWTLDGDPFNGNSAMLNNVLDAGVYEATITFNDTGCTATIATTVLELESCVFPEGISPNDDTMNDTFDLSSFNVTKLEIFNRNGTLVYSKTNYLDEWHGQTDDGEELPVGTYFYTVIYEGGAKSKSAWVYINR